MNKRDKIDNLLYELFEKENKKAPKDFSEFLKIKPYKKINQKKNQNFIKYKIAGIIIVVCTIMTTGFVSASKISNLLNSIFNLQDINLNNNNIIESINKNEYIQSCTDKEIKLNQDISLSIDYITLDSSNIYILFNAKSNNKSINEYRISILDLKLSGDNTQFYDSKINNSDKNKYNIPGWKKIESENNKTKELFFLYSNKIPEMEVLKIEFTSIIFYNDKNNEKFEINGNYKLNIELNERLKKQKKELYNTNNKKISEFYISNTGTYCILETKNIYENYSLFINDIEYKSAKLFVFNDIENGTYRFLLNYDFNIDEKNKKEINNITLKNEDNLEEIKIK